MMRYVFIVSVFFLTLFASPVPTQLNDRFYTDTYEKIVRFNYLHFSNDILDETSQEELTTIVSFIKKVQDQKKDFFVTVIGHKYDANAYYPQKNKNTLSYTTEEKELLDDKSATYAKKIAKKLRENVNDKERVSIVAKGGIYMAFSDEDQESADLSNRVMVSVYVIPPKGIDSDNDGIDDRYDRCAKTPEGVAVDINGCPLDSDNDGIADYQDKCADTPKGILVDAVGCPLDSDRDGIPDYKDQCPNTQEGLKVDPRGCPLKETLKLFFKKGSAKIMQDSYGEIKRFAEFLKKNPAYKVKIIGHTDSRGKAERNMNLSIERAKAVKKALELEGIEGSRIIIAGRGELDPIASNRTKEGRAKNRRIEIELFH